MGEGEGGRKRDRKGRYDEKEGVEEDDRNSWREETGKGKEWRNWKFLVRDGGERGERGVEGGEEKEER